MAPSRPSRVAKTSSNERFAEEFPKRYPHGASRTPNLTSIPLCKGSKPKICKALYIDWVPVLGAPTSNKKDAAWLTKLNTRQPQSKFICVKMPRGNIWEILKGQGFSSSDWTKITQRNASPYTLYQSCNHLIASESSPEPSDQELFSELSKSRSNLQ